MLSRLKQLFGGSPVPAESKNDDPSPPGITPAAVNADAPIVIDDAERFSVSLPAEVAKNEIYAAQNSPQAVDPEAVLRFVGRLNLKMKPGNEFPATAMKKTFFGTLSRAISAPNYLAFLPWTLNGDFADLSGQHRLKSLPATMNVRHLIANQCPALKTIGPGLRAWHLELRETAIVELPYDLSVEFKIDLTGCAQLQRLPANLKTGVLILSGCEALTQLPEGLDVSFLDITGCKTLTHFPAAGQLRCGRLIARDCVNLEALPKWLERVAVLDLRGCTKLSALPEGLRVDGWIDIAGTGITALPKSLQGVGLRWRGIPVTEQIVFHPETLTKDDLINERNAEVRRVILERMGFERFLQLADAQILDTDRDKGGERKLLNVKMENDEDLRCVTFICPSTARQYVMRIPPTVKTCHEAVAWMAGFDDPGEYVPDEET